MKRYRVTELGFIGRLVWPGEIIDVEGEPPIQGLVPVDDAPAPTPAPAPAPTAARPRRPRAAPPPDQSGDEADVI